MKDENDRLKEGTLPSTPISGSRAYGQLELVVPKKLTAKANEIIFGNNRVRAKYEGRGQTRSGGQAPGDYDETIVYEVLKRGGSLEDAASAVSARTNGLASSQGPEVCAALVKRVSEMVDGEAEQAAQTKLERESDSERRRAYRAKFKREREEERQAQLIEEFIAELAVESLTIHDCNPEVLYSMVLRGKTVVLTPDDLLSSQAFKKAMLVTLHKLLTVPRKQKSWDSIVNHWLSSATTVKTPARASSIEAFAEDLEAHLEDVEVGTTHSDFKRGCLVEVKHKQWLNPRPLRRALESRPEYSLEKLTAEMRRQGWKEGRTRIDTQQVRGWWRFAPVDLDADDCPMRAL